MARSISEIQQSIIDAKNADATLAGLDSTSSVSIWRLWTYIIAVAHWVLEHLFDMHKQEVNAMLAAQRAHTLQWYATKARQFQYGYALPPDADSYATINTDPSVMIVKNAAVVELPNLVRVKVAKQDSGALAPLTITELASLNAYMQQIKDAGIRLQVTSGAPDNLRLSLRVYYDPLVLNSTGDRLDGTSDDVVFTAVNEYLSSLPFNGIFVLNNLIASILKVDGVVNVSIVNAGAQYALLPFEPIIDQHIPDSGYLLLDEDYFNTFSTYTAHTPF